MPAQKNRCETTKSLKICYLFNNNQQQSTIPRSRTNWNDGSTANGPLWVARLLNVLFGEWRSIYVLVFVLEADILSTRCNKDDVMW